MPPFLQIQTGFSQILSIKRLMSVYYCQYNRYFSELLFLFNMHAAPDGLVGSLTVVQTTSSSVKINWTLPMLNKRGGVILKYMVTYQRVLQAGVSSVSSIQSNSTTMTEYMATGLTTGSQYMLAVSACTSAGCGPIENITANTSDNGRIACIKFLHLVFAYATCANACACSCPHPVSV